MLAFQERVVSEMRELRKVGREVMLRKPWYLRVQMFTPWNSLYFGIQFGNKFIGWQVRQPSEPS